jgi:DNA-binding response OmpR family regulator
MISPAERKQAGTLANRRPRVLIVDDDEIVRMLLHDICEEYGWNVVTVATRADAVLAAGFHHVQLMLVDFNLGRDDALGLLRDLHTLRPNTPIVVVSGEDPSRIAPRVTPLGADAVVGKPCSVAEVAALLGRYRRTSEPPPSL